MKNYYLLKSTAGRDLYLGLYSSKKQLRKGVDVWIKKKPTDILYYEKFEVNDPYNSATWDWCYIPKGSDLEELSIRGAECIPTEVFWGANLIHLHLSRFKVNYIEE